MRDHNGRTTQERRKKSNSRRADEREISLHAQKRNAPQKMRQPRLHLSASGGRALAAPNNAAKPAQRWHRLCQHGLPSCPYLPLCLETIFHIHPRPSCRSAHSHKLTAEAVHMHGILGKAGLANFEARQGFTNMRGPVWSSVENVIGSHGLAHAAAQMCRTLGCAGANRSKQNES